MRESSSPWRDFKKENAGERSWAILLKLCYKTNKHAFWSVRVKVFRLQLMLNLHSTFQTSKFAPAMCNTCFLQHKMQILLTTVVLVYMECVYRYYCGIHFKKVHTTKHCNGVFMCVLLLNNGCEVLMAEFNLCSEKRVFFQLPKHKNYNYWDAERAKSLHKSDKL